MQTTTRRFIALTAVLAGLVAQAPEGHAAGIGVYGLGNVTGSSSTPPPAGALLTGNFNFGFGAFVRGDLVPGLDLEIGADVIQRTYGVNGIGDFNFKALEIPVMVRLTAIPVLTAGAGLYGAFKLGDTVQNPNPLVGAPTLKGFDFGLIAALGVEFPLGPAGLFAELRYLFGLSDIDDGANSLQTRNIQGVAGVRIGI